MDSRFQTTAAADIAKNIRLEGKPAIFMRLAGRDDTPPWIGTKTIRSNVPIYALETDRVKNDPRAREEVILLITPPPYLGIDDQLRLHNGEVVSIVEFRAISPAGTPLAYKLRTVRHGFDGGLDGAEGGETSGAEA